MNIYRNVQGPLIFRIFKNDQPENIKKICELYADDTTVSWLEWLRRRGPRTDSYWLRETYNDSLNENSSKKQSHVTFGIYRVEWKNERKSWKSSIITNADDDDVISHHQISHLQHSLLLVFYKVKD